MWYENVIYVVHCIHLIIFTYSILSASWYIHAIMTCLQWKWYSDSGSLVTLPSSEPCVISVYQWDSWDFPDQYDRVQFKLLKDTELFQHWSGVRNALPRWRVREEERENLDFIHQEAPEVRGLAGIIQINYWFIGSRAEFSSGRGKGQRRVWVCVLGVGKNITSQHKIHIQSLQK